MTEYLRFGEVELKLETAQARCFKIDGQVLWCPKKNHKWYPSVENRKMGTLEAQEWWARKNNLL